MRRRAIQRMSPKTALTPRQQRHENILKSLTVINAAGWLRPAELGAFVWPKNALPKAPASALVRSLLASDLVHAVALPDRAGQALTLARKGASLLRRERQLDATAIERWEPPGSWRHDLLAVGVLAQLYRAEWQVIPEAWIRRRVGLRSVPKMADGLARDPSGAWWWFEMEHARKTGPAMRHLAQTAAGIGLGTISLLDRRPVGMLIGYPAAARDEGGDRIDHRLRVTRAIEQACSGPVRLAWAACEVQGAGVASCTLEGSTAHPDGARRVLGVLEANGWAVDAAGWLVAQYHPYEARVRESRWDPPWEYEVRGPGISPEALPTVENVTAAKLAAAGVIADAVAAGQAARARERQ